MLWAGYLMGRVFARMVYSVSVRSGEMKRT